MEAAFVLPILILFIAAPLFLGRFFWYYSVAEKAAHDSARFLSAASRVEIQASTGGAEPSIAALAKSIAEDEIAEIAPSLQAVTITTQCDYATCGGQTLPQTVRVSVQITVRDNIFPFITEPIFGEDGFTFVSAVSMRFAGT